MPNFTHNRLEKPRKPKKKSKKKDSKKRHKKNASNSESNSISADEDEYKFDRSEVIRLTSELLLMSESLGKEMREIYKKLDNKETVLLDNLEDKSLKKKLRHIFQSLNLVKKEIEGHQGYKKPKSCNLKLVKVYEKILIEAKKILSDRISHKTEYFKVVDDHTTVNSNRVQAEVDKFPVSSGPTMPTLDDLNEMREFIQETTSEHVYNDNYHSANTEQCEGNQRASKRELWMIESPDALEGLFHTKKKIEKNKIDRFKKREEEEKERKLQEFMNEYNKQYRSQSLLEMHKNGMFENLKEKQNEFIKNHQYGAHDPYIKSSSRNKQNKNDPPAWRPFDRETDLEIKRHIQSDDFHRLLDQSKNLTERFGRGKFQSSFL